jgi:hypothetical protein
MRVIATSESLQDYWVKIYARLADAVARQLATAIVTRKTIDGQDPPGSARTSATTSTGRSPSSRRDSRTSGASAPGQRIRHLLA